MALIIDAVRSLVTPAFMSRAMTETGEPETAITKGLGAVIPALLASLSARSDDRDLMSQVVTLATKTAGDADFVASTEQFSSTKPPGVGAVPNAWVSSVFGGGMSSVVGGVARYAGVKSSTASSLLTMAAPLVLGYLGRLMRTDNLDANTLADRLRRERQSFVSALPPGLDALIPGVVRTPVEAARMVTPEVPGAPRRLEQPPSALSWVLPLILGAAALTGLLWWLGRDRADDQIGARVSDEVTAGTTGVVADSITRVLPNTMILQIPQGGMEDRLVAYLTVPSTASEAKFDFDRIGFQAGSTSLTAQSREQIRTIASILEAYPNVRVTVAGYTDNAGDDRANIELSRFRATAVMDALRDMGVSPARMQVRGHGSQDPVADNATEEGRARNRRVTLHVTSR
ncbi:MAG: OmpA family protein [Vicinamibacterales bacterium]